MSFHVVPDRSTLASENGAQVHCLGALRDGRVVAALWNHVSRETVLRVHARGSLLILRERSLGAQYVSFVRTVGNDAVVVFSRGDRPRAFLVDTLEPVLFAGHVADESLLGEDGTFVAATCVASAGDDAIVAAHVDDMVRTWPGGSKFELPSLLPYHVAALPDGSVVLGGRCRRIRLAARWRSHYALVRQRADGVCLRRHRLSTAVDVMIALSDGRIATSHRETVVLRDAETLKCTLTLRSDAAPVDGAMGDGSVSECVRGMTQLRDGRLVASRGTCCDVWDVTTGQLLSRWSELGYITVSHNSPPIAATSDGGFVVTLNGVLRAYTVSPWERRRAAVAGWW